MGERAIAPMGHVRMMAAVQPFLSGAISKTVNLPETATVEEIEDVYFQGWKLGLKALAVYRDNCKVGQPLSDGKAQERRAPADDEVAPTVETTVVEYRPVRKRLPKKRPVADDVVLRRRRRGLPDRRRPTRTTASARSSSRCRQAGLDPGRRDGRLLDRHLDRPAVRRAAGDLRREVHQHALRAGRHDRRPGRPDGAVDHGLHLPSPGAGLPATSTTRSAYGIYTADERARQLETGLRTRPTSPTRTVEEELETLAQSAPVAERPGRDRAGRSRGASRRAPAAAGRPRARSHSSAELLEQFTRHGGRRAAVHDLRHEDAPGRLLLRLRGLRLDQRLQLMMMR